MRAQKLIWCHAFVAACADLDIEHRLTEPRYPCTTGQVERMSGVIADAAVKRYRHNQLRQHLGDFVAAHNFGHRLKNLRGVTPYEALCKAWADAATSFTSNPHHQTPGPNIWR